MLRNRVFVSSALIIGLVAILELAGMVVAIRMQAALETAATWAREVTLNLELDAFVVRAAGEAASAYLAGEDEYAREAREALEEAGGRYRALQELDRGQDELREHARSVRQTQERILAFLANAVAPLGGAQSLGDGGPLAMAQQVYAYEAVLSELREREGALERESAALAGKRVTRWRLLSEVLGVARLSALVLLVVLVTLLVQRRLVAPLAELARAAERVSGGDFQTQVVERGETEIGGLQRAFNSMTARLARFEVQAREREDQLRAALQRAEESSRAKTAFVANISHELRTPMHGVLGTADLLARDALEGRQRQRVETIRNSAEALLAVINDVLDLSKLDAGRMEITFAAFNLPRLVDQITSLVRSRAMQKGLELHVSIERELSPWVLGDAGRLRQILLNLLGNAVKFTSQGSVELSVQGGAGQSGVLHFEVSDSGPGISDEAVQRIFMPFEQADASVSRRHGGTGLGLAIASMLAQAMGGEVGVRSVVGSGSTFWCELPMPSCEPPPPAEAGARGGCERFAGRVLVVDDHAVNRAVAEAMLQELGCECELAVTGRQAVDAAHAERYELILMDCQMPEMDGFSATRLIRKMESIDGPRTVIVAMTAGAMQSDREAAQSAGMDDFLAKPFTVEELRRVLVRWLDPVR